MWRVNAMEDLRRVIVLVIVAAVVVGGGSAVAGDGAKACSNLSEGPLEFAPKSARTCARIYSDLCQSLKESFRSADQVSFTIHNRALVILYLRSHDR